MALRVIGAGFGRTGTMSLKLALEQIGFGPCYHMAEVMKNPAAPGHWATLARGGRVDWDVVFEGYQSTVDWPSTDYWEELAAHAPEARIILTTRDPEAWFRSTQATIFGDINAGMIQADTDTGVMVRAILQRNFGGRPDDRAACIAAFEAHNARVRRTVPAHRLLDYDVSRGWGPLCAFLGVPVPDAPFPSVNSTADFRTRHAERQAAAGRA